MTKALLEKNDLGRNQEFIFWNFVWNLGFYKIQKAKDHWGRVDWKKIETELSDLNEISLVHLEGEFSNYKELYPREQ